MSLKKQNCQYSLSLLLIGACLLETVGCQSPRASTEHASSPLKGIRQFDVYAALPAADIAVLIDLMKKVGHVEVVHQQAINDKTALILLSQKQSACEQFMQLEVVSAVTIDLNGVSQTCSIWQIARHPTPSVYPVSVGEAIAFEKNTALPDTLSDIFNDLISGFMEEYRRGNNPSLLPSFRIIAP